MSESHVKPAGRRALTVPMQPRSPHETHRASTPLELLFDLVFVVAVAQAAAHLHHGLVEDHVGTAVLGYGMVFFAIWWAWMNFTWFASAYDTDDVPYRLAVFVQITGALILAAGVPRAFDEREFTIVTIGYGVMRLGLLASWLRAARSDPARRTTAYRYVAGVSAVQAAWFVLLGIPAPWRLSGFVILVIIELLIPIWAERSANTSWHRGHIAERYGLFTIIVLGESILSASMAIQSALADGDLNLGLATIIIGGLLTVFVLWWLYFYQPMDDQLTSARVAFIWGYGHLFIFAAVAAVGAGLAVSIDHATDHAEIGLVGAGAAVAIPVALYLVALWLLHPRARGQGLSSSLLLPLTALLILLTPFTGQAVLLTGLLLSSLLAIKLIRHEPSDLTVHGD